MDPFTQGILGAAAAQSAAKKDDVRNATVCGIIGGMAPDLDVFIRSSADPMLALDFHRHFTHSLPFVPFGSLLVAIALYPLFRKWGFKKVYLFSFLGYLTHGLLDACTSYGTRLYWPLSNLRVAWDMVSIIDIFATLPMFVLVILAIFHRSKIFGRIGLTLFLSYLGLGLLQHHRVENYVAEVAHTRGHTVERIKLNPTFSNNIVWRTVYEHKGRFYVNAVRMPYFGVPKLYAGNPKGVKRIDAEKIFPTLPAGSVAREDLRRFRYFAQDFLVQVDANTIGDLRYSFSAYGSEPLWDVTVDPKHPENHITRTSLSRVTGRKWDEYKSMLKGEELPSQFEINRSNPAGS